VTGAADPQHLIRSRALETLLLNLVKVNVDMMSLPAMESRVNNANRRRTLSVVAPEES
jgi:hypothetical protein